MSKRATKHQLDERVDFVADMLVRRIPRLQIVSDTMSRFGVKERQAASYIRSAYLKWAKLAESERELKRLEQREALLALYREARESKEYSICVQIERLLMRIDGTEFSAEKDVSAKPIRLVVEDARVGI